MRWLGAAGAVQTHRSRVTALRDLRPATRSPPGSGTQPSGSGEAAWHLYALVFSPVRWRGPQKILAEIKRLGKLKTHVLGSGLIFI